MATATMQDQSGAPEASDANHHSRVSDPMKHVRDFNWGDLEERYQQRMSECTLVEENILDEFNDWIKVNISSSDENSMAQTSADL